MKNNKIIIVLFAIIIGIICTYLTSNVPGADENIQKEISEKIIRFHVRANSDSDEDQALKLLVKDQVVAYLSDAMKSSDSKDNSISYIESHIDEIKEIAINVIRKEGYNYSVSAYITNEFFPTKNYGDVTIPCGNYDAFRIDIGNNSGKNWWCVLYPPLCFVQGSYGVATDETKAMFKTVLDEDEFDYITNAKRSDITFDFKLRSLFDK